MRTRSGPRGLTVTAGLAIAVALASVVAPVLVASPASAATGSCAGVGGGTVTSAGPSRATVLVDTGSGPVWAACISFSGAISGAKALTLAASVITDLDPYFAIYSGNGVAVCQLRHVGYRTPDCLTADPHGTYWQYFRDGSYAAGGAGTSKVVDGSVEAWRWGGSGPWARSATMGTRAVAGTPTTTTTTTTTGPPVTTTVPAAVTTVPTGRAVTPVGATSTTLPASHTAADGAAGTTIAAAAAPRAATGGRGAAAGSSDPSGSGASDGTVRAASAGVGALPAATSNAAGGSGPTTVLGVLGALAIIGGLGVAARRRRRPLPA